MWCCQAWQWWPWSTSFAWHLSAPPNSQWVVSRRHQWVASSGWWWMFSGCQWPPGVPQVCLVPLSLPQKTFRNMRGKEDRKRKKETGFKRVVNYCPTHWWHMKAPIKQPLTPQKPAFICTFTFSITHNRLLLQTLINWNVPTENSPSKHQANFTTETGFHLHFYFLCNTQPMSASNAEQLKCPYSDKFPPKNQAQLTTKKQLSSALLLSL